MTEDTGEAIMNKTPQIAVLPILAGTKTTQDVIQFQINFVRALWGLYGFKV